MSSPFAIYLDDLHRIRASGLATDERSYYPPLAALLRAYGERLAPRVNAIHEIADRGAGHPDFALETEPAHDLRAAVEVKGLAEDVEALARSEQARRYLAQHDPILVTNLRDFALVRRGPDGSGEIVMRYTLAPSEAQFWQTPVRELVGQHEAGLTDFLLSVMTWDADITRPRDLAEALARYAREALRRLASQPVATLAPLRRALSDALGLHFTDEQGEHFFRSSLTQTLFYGLFSAWVVWNGSRAQLGSRADDVFRWREASDSLSLPVLRELFDHIAIPSQLEGLDIRTPIEWAEATLRRTNWDAFAAAFDQGDAVNYFYEPFLEAFDPTLREQLGVWYTPREIIRYQVARVDRLLRDELHKPLGLADPDVITLDPATGTGGYLLEVLRTIDATLREQGMGALRALKLRQAATQRVFGFEILPAPFVVAHLQIATLLASLGAPIATPHAPAHSAPHGATITERAGVYLTNSLTGWKLDDHTQMSFPEFPALKGEAEAAAHVKHEAKILVILGNPPYRGPAGVAEDEEKDLLAPYYVGLDQFGVQARGINDLYVRFFRLAERQIAETTGRGVVSFISNYSWLTGLSHPIMRKHILDGFDTVWIDNLNGDKFKTGKRTPWGTSDQSVFTTESDPRGIQVGTAITTLVRSPGQDAKAVYWREFWGLASDKRAALLRSLDDHNATQPYTPLTPTKDNRYSLAPGGAEADYLTWPLLTKLFPAYYTGVKTSRDEVLIADERATLEERMRQYYDPDVSNEVIKVRLPRFMESTGRYDAIETRRILLRHGFVPQNVRRYYYRPMDVRWLYWEGTTKLLDEKRSEFWEQVFDGNLFMEARQHQPKADFDRTMVTPFLADNVGNGLSSYFPMYVRQRAAGTELRAPNINPAVAQDLRKALQFDSDGALMEELFFHTVAITQSPAYRTENATALAQDWPRIPIPATREALAASAALGRRVADLLRPDVPFVAPPELRGLAEPTRVDGSQLGADDLRVTVRYAGVGRYEPPTAGRGGRLWWNDVGYWANVPAEVWAFTIGGYPVVKKWLDYRHESKLGRPLRLEEVAYVREMVQRIAALRALGAALDANYAEVKGMALSPAPPPQGEGS